MSHSYTKASHHSDAKITVFFQTHIFLLSHLLFKIHVLNFHFNEPYKEFLQRFVTNPYHPLIIHLLVSLHFNARVYSLFSLYSKYMDSTGSAVLLVGWGVRGEGAWGEQALQSCFGQRMGTQELFRSSQKSHSIKYGAFFVKWSVTVCQIIYLLNL